MCIRDSLIGLSCKPESIVGAGSPTDRDMERIELDRRYCIAGNIPFRLAHPEQLPPKLLVAHKVGRIVETDYQPPGHWSMLDEEYLDSAPTEKEKNKRERRLAQRDASWRLLAPVSYTHLDVYKRQMHNHSDWTRG